MATTIQPSELERMSGEDLHALIDILEERAKGGA